MKKEIEKIINTIDCSVTIDSVKDGGFCGVIAKKANPHRFSFLFGYNTLSTKKISYPTLSEYAQALPGLISWGASDVIIENGVVFAISPTAKKPFAEFLPSKPKTQKP